MCKIRICNTKKIYFETHLLFIWSHFQVSILENVPQNCQETRIATLSILFNTSLILALSFLSSRNLCPICFTLCTELPSCVWTMQSLKFLSAAQNKIESLPQAWMPDGYSRTLRSYVFGLSGLWLRYATLQNLIPSFPWIAPPRPPP